LLRQHGKLKKTTDIKGYITDFEKNTEELIVDVGFSSRKSCVHESRYNGCRLNSPTVLKLPQTRYLNCGLYAEIAISVNIVQLDEKENHMKVNCQTTK